MSKYTIEQVEACILAYRNGDLNYCRAGIIDLLTAYAATLKAAQGGVTEAFNWTEFWNRISQSFSSKCVDEVYACYEAGKRAALSAEPAAQVEARSSHRVFRREDWLPCYCAAQADHPIGAEKSEQPVERVPEGYVVCRIPDEMQPQLCAPISIDWMARQGGHRDGWNACRKAMLETVLAATPAAPAEGGKGADAWCYRTPEAARFQAQFDDGDEE